MLAILLGGIALRVVSIESRPLHPDEGVNHFFVTKIFELGYYPYSHENYHGPLFHYLNAAVVAVTAESVISLRLTSIILGCLLFIAPLCFGKIIGNTTALLSSLLLALSPSMVFHSRYAIHETSFILWQLLLALLLFRRAQRSHTLSTETLQRTDRDFYLIGLLIVALIATKETFLIACFCLLLSFFSLPGTLSHFTTQFFSNCREQKQSVYRAFLVSFTLLIAIFTAGFRWPRGIYELALAAKQWLARGTKTDPSHFKSFAYYIHDLILPLEPQLLIIPLLGVLLFHSRFFFAEGGNYRRVLAVWSLTTLAVYSLIPYKTPWLVINITLPLLLLTAASLAQIFEQIQNVRLKQLTLGVIVLVEASQSINLNFQTFPLPGKEVQLAGYSLRNPFSYGHTTLDTLHLAEKIKSYHAQHGGKILVAAPLYWPLPYYVRELAKDMSFHTTFNPEKYAERFNIIVADDRISWQPSEFDREHVRLTDVQQAWVYFRREVSP